MTESDSGSPRKDRPIPQLEEAYKHALLAHDKDPELSIIKEGSYSAFSFEVYSLPMPFENSEYTHIVLLRGQLSIASKGFGILTDGTVEYFNDGLEERNKVLSDPELSETVTDLIGRTERQLTEEGEAIDHELTLAQVDKLLEEEELGINILNPQEIKGVLAGIILALIKQGVKIKNLKDYTDALASQPAHEVFKRFIENMSNQMVNRVSRWSHNGESYELRSSERDGKPYSLKFTRRTQTAKQNELIYENVEMWDFYSDKPSEYYIRAFINVESLPKDFAVFQMAVSANKEALLRVREMRETGQTVATPDQIQAGLEILREQSGMK